MKKILILLTIFISLLSNAQFENVRLPRPPKAKYYYSQVEPSIYINPNKVNEVIAGSVLNDYYYSLDTGRTWVAKSLKSKWGVNGDPCVIIDNAGRYYYFHLSNIKGEHLVGGIVSQRANEIDGKFKYQGHTIANDKYHDKEWAVANPKTNEIYLTWTQFDQYDSDSKFDKSFILFSKSSDGGLNWSAPKTISKFPGDCKDNDQTAEGAVPAIGPNGELYVAWSRDNVIWFNASFDNGETWMEEEIKISDQPEGWVIDIPGIFRCNGLPITLCDYSTSTNNGTIYVNWADQRNGKNNTDIWVIKSTDKGKTWTEPKRVNDDESNKHQFLTWMTIDQVTGYLYCVFYDRRNHENNLTDVYLAVSKDGAESFKNYKISKSAFNPNDKAFFGDYTNISAHNGIIRPIWTRLDNLKISLFTALISQEQLNEIDNLKD